jgi:hypothetical protein
VDLNKLYYDHQVLLMKVCQAPTWHGRSQHVARASHLAGCIGRVQRGLGAAAATAWEAASTSAARGGRPSGWQAAS